MEKIPIAKPVIVEPVIDVAPVTDTKAVVSPKTTAEEDRHSTGQRRINLIWELTQTAIALSVIWSAVGAAVWIVVSDTSNRLMAFLFLSNVVSIVIGFYFGRTNHQRVGGVDLGR